MDKTVKLWFVLTPKGNVYKCAFGECHAGHTRQKAIASLCAMNAYGGKSIEDIWAWWKSEGYTCRRLDVALAKIMEGK